MSTVLVVDDKEMLRDSIGVTLQRAGFTVIAAGDGEAALELIARRRPDAVVTDLKMPGLDGIGLIEKVREIDDVLPIVLMTAFGTIETAVKAIRMGAYDYITKPFEGDELVIAIRRAISHASLRRENEALRAVQDSREETASASSTTALRGTARVLGDSPVMREIKEKIRTVAPTQGTVLISGESGTGKEVVARAVHEISDRNGKPFLAVNCAAMSESLLESELFGHEKGAFTGADSLRKGRFELAHGGTLLLDEISEVRPQIQAKLLRVLQERAFERVGSSTTIGVDVRVIATTNRNLEEEVRRGSFRQDLFYRLNVLPVSLPSLRRRRSDIPLLASHFVRTVAEREGRPAREIEPDAAELLVMYPWPGNVRELQNLCERAVVLCQSTTITAELIRPWLSTEHGSVEAPSMVSASADAATVESRPMMQSVASELKPLSVVEREVIVETLHRFNGHRQKTAQALGIGVRTLGLKLKKWKEERLVAETL
ncbi:MAG: sigma-54 dependent transcriptional regulator [Phycisphaerales bacterium]